jgi:metastasis-associated protein MTA
MGPINYYGASVPNGAGSGSRSSAAGGGGGSGDSSSSNSANMYRVGDYVYFENSSSASYALRRIEELNKTSTGAVEARVICFYRRSELPQSLLAQADKHHWGDSMVSGPNEEDPNNTGSDSDDEESPEVLKQKADRAAFRLREVFLTRQAETLPATLIRGKCSVTLLSEVETMESYSGREDAFFYALVYDPHNKTLVADRGEIRIGSGYQASVSQKLKEGEEDARDLNELEDHRWSTANSLEVADIDKYLIVSRSVGTFARALDCSSSIKQPSLHMSAAAASRDITLFRAYDLLHEHSYNLTTAIKALVPSNGPMLCRDEMEDWSASEANLFEEAIEKYGKDFNDIKKDFLPWKTMKNIIEYFFMWKTTDRYVQQKRVKALESESKLKQVYVPSYTNKSTRLTGANGDIFIRGRDCDAYPKLAKYSWAQYKKYGKFVPAKSTDDSFILDKSFANSPAARLAQLRPGLIIEPGSPSMGQKNGKGKTRPAFFLRTTPIARAARQICRKMQDIRRAARRPGKTLEMKAIKVETKAQVVNLDSKKIRQYNTFKVRDRADMEAVCKKLGQKDIEKQEWLVLTPKDMMPQPKHQAWPRPAKKDDGSYIYERVPSYQPAAAAGGHHHPQMLYKKRAYEERETAPPTGANSSAAAASGGGGAAKIQRTVAPGMGRGHIPNHVPPKGRVATLTRIHGSGGPRQVISWMDAPDDVYYKATAVTKKLRKGLSTVALRKAARKPFKKVLKLPSQAPVFPVAPIPAMN